MNPRHWWYGKDLRKWRFMTACGDYRGPFCTFSHECGLPRSAVEQSDILHYYARERDLETKPRRGHAYSSTCGCPGCQFLYAGLEQFRKFGPPPVIGTFEPTIGDVGRDYDRPVAQYRTWMGDRWHPYYEVIPKQEGPK